MTSTELGRRHLSRRLLIPLIAVLVALYGLLVGGSYLLRLSVVEDNVRRTSETAGALYRGELESEAGRLAGLLELLVRSRGLRTSFEARDRRGLLESAGRLFSRLRARSPVTHLYFIEPDGSVFLRVHEPSVHGDQIDRHTFKQAQTSRQLSTGLELGPLGTLTLRTVVPWRDGDRLLGYVELGEEIGHVVDTMQAVTHTQLAVAVDKKNVDRASWRRGMALAGRSGDWNRLDDHVLLDRTFDALPRGLDVFLQRDEPDGIGRLRGAATDLWVTGVPINTADDREIGTILLFHDVTAAMRELNDGLLFVAGTAGAAALTVIGFLVLVVRRAEDAGHTYEQRLREENAERVALQERYIRELESNQADLKVLTEELQVHRDRLSEAQHVARMGHWGWDLGSGRLECSDQLLAVFGLTPEQFVHTRDDLERFINADDLPHVRLQLEAAIAQGGGYNAEYRIVRPNGEQRLVYEQAEVERGDDGRPVRIVGTTQDITELRESDALVRRLGHVFDESTNDIYIVDAESLGIVQMNETARSHLGYSEQQAATLTFFDIVGEMSRQRFESMAAPLIAGTETESRTETFHQRSDGSSYPVELRLQYSDREDPPVFIAIALDISERVSHERQLEYHTSHDTLTNLPNRHLIAERLAEQIASAREGGEPTALLLIDINRLKEINDTLGHRSGDQVLREVGERLRGLLSPSATLGRISGDEFCAVLPDTDGRRVEGVVRHVRKALEKSIKVDRMHLSIGTTLGVAVYPDHGDDASTLMRRADIALHHAKEDRRPWAIYETDRDGFSVRRLNLISRLRTAIGQEEFTLYYQPKVAIATGEIIEFEALLRWNHPNYGLVGPGEFIPLAEESGHIHKLTYWVLEQACLRLAEWEKRGLPWRLGVNLSARNLMETDLADALAAISSERRLAPDRLTLEVTESAVMMDPDRSTALLQEFADMGLRIAIDDYGTGYSSLSYLKRLPATELKIDRSFITDMDHDENIAIIARSTIELAHNLGMQVSAEGVETRDVWQLLAILGCDHAQGYYLTEPLPEEEFLRWCDHAGPPELGKATG